jgi:hypothetical protein
MRSIEFGWRTYLSTEKEGKDYVVAEVWKRRKGPRGKSMLELLRERDELEKQINSVQKQFFEGTLDEGSYRKTMRPLIRREEKVSDKLKRDFHVDQ